jgi:GNAT superfamily N-acetyltransferase
MGLTGAMPVRAEDVTIRPIEVADAGEVLTLQRAAFVQEALIYDTVRMPPLTQTLDELEAELVDNLGCVALAGHRTVGAPDVQGAGIGSRLLEAVEERGRAEGCRTAELFTGSLSEANLRLYTRLGYRETQRVDGDDGIQQVFLRKQLA